MFTLNEKLKMDYLDLIFLLIIVTFIGHSKFSLLKVTLCLFSQKSHTLFLLFKGQQKRSSGSIKRRRK